LKSCAATAVGQHLLPAPHAQVVEHALDLGRRLEGLVGLVEVLARHQRGVGHVAAAVEEGRAAVVVARLQRFEHDLVLRIAGGRQEFRQADPHGRFQLRDGYRARLRLGRGVLRHRAAIGQPLRQAAIQDHQAIGGHAVVHQVPEQACGEVGAALVVDHELLVRVHAPGTQMRLYLLDGKLARTEGEQRGRHCARYVLLPVQWRR
jgi:hypothetical protein